MMSWKYRLSLIALFTSASVLYGQGFSTPYQSPLTAAGNTQRYAAGAASVNGTTWIAYTASNGQVYLAHDTSGNLQFGSAQAAYSIQGAITAAGNPALAYDSASGRLYMAFIQNGNVSVTYSTNPSQGFGGLVGLASGADASPSITSNNGTVYVGYHKNSGQTTAICYLLNGTNGACSTPSGGGSTYGPGLAFFNGQLWTIFQSNNSAHSLYYFTSSVNSDGSIANFSLGTDSSSDQTSGQPSALALSGSVLLVGFRSNDASANFITKAYHYGGGSSANYWTNGYNNNISISGSPTLVAVPGTTASMVFVGKNSPNYIYSTSSTNGF